MASGNGVERLGAGFGMDVSDSLRIGFGISQGRVSVDLDGGGDSADADRTALCICRNGQD